MKEKEKKHKSKVEAALALLKEQEKASKKEQDSQEQEESKSFKPMTKEEWDLRQSEVRRVYDPETGRNRLVKGDGEIIEEIVSKDRHKEINKQSTEGDGLWYAKKMGTTWKYTQK